MMRLQTLWTSPIRLIVMVLVGLAILAAAFVTLAVVLLLLGGAILHFYVRRQLRRARPSASKHVIDVEYRVVDRP